MASRPLDGAQAMCEGGLGFIWCKGWPPLSPMFPSLLSHHLLTNRGSRSLRSFIPSDTLYTHFSFWHLIVTISLIALIPTLVPLTLNIQTWTLSTFSSLLHNAHLINS